MTAMVFLVDPDQLRRASAGGEIVVAGTEGHHGAAVRRLRANEPVDLVDGRGRRVSGVVASVGRREFVVVAASISDEPRPRPDLMVVQALAKGDRSLLAVEMLTEVGVDNIIPWQASRSVARWEGPKRARGRDRWVATARAATKQARRAWAPTIGNLSTTAEVSTLLRKADLAIVLDEASDGRLVDMRWPTEGLISLVVGPEGGITPEELAQFAEVGALGVRMGPSVLRASTAGVVAAGLMMAGSGRWR